MAAGKSDPSEIFMYQLYQFPTDEAKKNKMKDCEAGKVIRKENITKPNLEWYEIGVPTPLMLEQHHQLYILTR